jgi:copper(I)-binding protein
MTSSFAIKFVAVCALSAGAAAAFAQNAAPVEASGAWVRAAVSGQSGTGAFMKLTAQAPLKLVGVATPVAGVAEVHEMKLEGDTMKMRGVPALDLPARQAVELKPGGYHVMLMDLQQPIRVGGSVPLTLTFEDAKGVKSTLALQVPVQAGAPGGMAGHKH